MLVPIPTPTPVQGYGDGRFAASSYKINKKKVLVKSLTFFLYLFLFCLNLVQVRLDLPHQRRYGNVRAAQRLGLQQVLQLFRLGRVNARVLRRVGLLLFLHFHPLADWSAATDFCSQRLLPCKGVGVVRQDDELIAHVAQLRVRGSRRHVDGNHEVFDCFVVAIGRVSGGTVGGMGL